MSEHLVQLTVNGDQTSGRVPSTRTLLDYLRDDMELTGTKTNCNDGDCGACTVLLNGQPVNSCLVLAAEVDGADVTTVEGLATGDHLHPVQQGFVAEGGSQCGFCTPGLIISTVALLDDDPAADEQVMKERLAGNLCRCTGYTKVFESVRRAQEITIAGRPGDEE